MKFEYKHILWALVIAIGWVLLSWLPGLIFANIPSVGDFIVRVLSLVWIYGLVYAGMKSVKGLTNGLVTGLIYGLVFAVVSIIFHYIAWGGTPPYISFGGEWGAFFGWPGMWGELIAVILFGGCIGWVNESK